MDDLKAKLDTLHQASLDKSAQLMNEDRGDDAALEKIHGNMYDIARQILQAARKLHADDESAALAFLQQRLGGLVDTWEKARMGAVSRDDTIRIVQEQIKVDTMRDICEIVRGFAGGQDD